MRLREKLEEAKETIASLERSLSEAKAAVVSARAATAIEQAKAERYKESYTLLNRKFQTLAERAARVPMGETRRDSFKVEPATPDDDGRTDQPAS